MTYLHSFTKKCHLLSIPARRGLVLMLLAALFFGAAPPQAAQAAPGTWTTSGNLNTARYGHTATLLPDDKVLVAGGWGLLGHRWTGRLNSSEVYDRGLGFDQAWRPTVTTATSPLVLGSPLVASGSGFRGYGLTEASGGHTQSSATNYPLVQLRRVDNEQML